MVAFRPIYDQALARAGGAEALEQRLARPLSAAELRAVPDDRYLSLMSRRIFRAGLKHSMVDAKWPAFEDAFNGFDPARAAALQEGDLEALMRDARLIRHRAKLRAVRDNAQALMALVAARGGFGSYLADWPSHDVVGLWDDLARRFSQMGGGSGPSFLRMAGRDTFILTEWVVRGLLAWGALPAEPKGKRGARQAQEIFNGWAVESGRPLCQLSQIVALSVP